MGAVDIGAGVGVVMVVVVAVLVDIVPLAVLLVFEVAPLDVFDAVVV